MTTKIFRSKHIQLTFWRLFVGLLVASTLLANVAGEDLTRPVDSRNKMGGGNYTSPAFGFSYTYPIQLIRNTADFRSKLGPHVKGERTTLVLLSAYEAPSATSAREGVVIMAVDGSYFGGLRDGRDYLRTITGPFERQGWVVLRQELPVTIDGHQFFRSDYVFRRKSPPIFESSVCTVRNGYALDFVLAGGSASDIEQLFRSLSTIHFESLSGHQKPANDGHLKTGQRE